MLGLQTAPQISEQVVPGLSSTAIRRTCIRRQEKSFGLCAQCDEVLVPQSGDEEAYLAPHLESQRSLQMTVHNRK